MQGAPTLQCDVDAASAGCRWWPPPFAAGWGQRNIDAARRLWTWRITPVNLKGIPWWHGQWDGSWAVWWHPPGDHLYLAPVRKCSEG